MSSLNLLDYLARLLAATGEYAYNPDKPYTLDDIGPRIIFGLPAETPDTVVAMQTYSVTETVTGENVIGLQIIVRAAAGERAATPQDAALRISEHLNSVLHGLGNRYVSAQLQIAQILRQSWAHIGPDASDRYVITSNYYVTSTATTAMPH